MHHDPPGLSPLLRFVADTAPSIISLLWLLLLAIVLVLCRGIIREALTALVERIGRGSEVEAFGVRVGASPEVTVGTLPDSLREVGATAKPPGTGKEAALGALTPHRTMRTLIAVGPAPFQRVRDPRSVAHADAEALAHVNAVLAGQASGETLLAMVATDEAARACLEDNRSVVAVGGPIANPLTARLLPELAPRFSITARALRDEGSGQVWASVGPPDGRARTDCVLVAGGPHPLRRDGWCTAVAACLGPGMVPALNWLLDARQSHLWPSGTDWKGFQVVVEVSFDSEGWPTAEVVAQLGLPPR